MRLSSLRSIALTGVLFTTFGCAQQPMTPPTASHAPMTIQQAANRVRADQMTEFQEVEQGATTVPTGTITERTRTSEESVSVPDVSAEATASEVSTLPLESMRSIQQMERRERVGERREEGRIRERRERGRIGERRERERIDDRDRIGERGRIGERLERRRRWRHANWWRNYELNYGGQFYGVRWWDNQYWYPVIENAVVYYIPVPATETAIVEDVEPVEPDEPIAY